MAIFVSGYTTLAEGIESKCIWCTFTKFCVEISLLSLFHVNKCWKHQINNFLGRTVITCVICQLNVMKHANQIMQSRVYAGAMEKGVMRPLWKQNKRTVYLSITNNRTSKTNKLSIHISTFKTNLCMKNPLEAEIKHLIIAWT